MNVDEFVEVDPEKMSGARCFTGTRVPIKHGREMCRYNFPYGRAWLGKVYPIKQVAPVITEEAKEIVVITVYTFYF
jgi:hypothetical protein